MSAGATGRNGGHLWPSSNIVNAKKLGQTVVNQVYQFDLQTMALMEQFIEKHNVRCNYQISGITIIYKLLLSTKMLLDQVLLVLLRLHQRSLSSRKRENRSRL